MSIVINCRDPIVRQVVELLLPELTVTIPGDGKFNPETTNSIYCFRGEFLFLPLHFARNKCGRLVNWIVSSNGAIFPPGELNSRFSFEGKLRDGQVEICRQAYDLICRQGTALIGANMGSGKTVMGLKIASIFSGIGKVIVLVTNCNLANQWLQTVEKFSSARAAIYVRQGVQARRKFPGVENLDLIIIKERSWLAAQQEESELANCGLLIADEIHTYKRISRVENLLGFHPRLCLFLSATYSGPAKLLTEPIIGQDSLVLAPDDRRYSQLYYLNTEIKFEMPTSERGTVDWGKLVQAIISHQGRNRLIVDLVRKHMNDHKILLMTWRNAEHAEILSKELNSIGIDNSLYTGNSRTYTDKQVLIGTIGKIGTGFDEKTACSDFSGQTIDLIILVTSVKSKILAEQILGRAFRSEEPKMLVLVDENFLIKSHWRTISSHLESRGSRIMKYWPDMPRQLAWKYR